LGFVRFGFLRFLAILGPLTTLSQRTPFYKAEYTKLDKFRYAAALIKEISADTRMIVTVARNTKASATAPIERNASAQRQALSSQFHGSLA
jgi:hypothetical protein